MSTEQQSRYSNPSSSAVNTAGTGFSNTEGSNSNTIRILNSNSTVNAYAPLRKTATLSTEQNNAAISNRINGLQRDPFHHLLNHYRRAIANSQCQAQSGWHVMGKACQHKSISGSGIAIKGLSAKRNQSGQKIYHLELFQGTFAQGKLGTGKIVNIEFSPSDIEFNYAKLFSSLTKNPADIHQLLDPNSRQHVVISSHTYRPSPDHITAARQQRLEQLQQQKIQRQHTLQQQKQAQQQRVKWAQQQQQTRAEQQNPQ